AVTAPTSLIISAFAPVLDVRQTLTPQIRTDKGATQLLLVDLGEGRNRLGGSILAQVYNQLGDEPADLNRPELLRGFFEAIQASLAAGDLLAYHDRSDGGLLVTLAEMAFAGHCGLDINISGLGDDALAVLFSEEPGAVLQVSREKSAAVIARFAGAGLKVQVIRQPNEEDW